MFRRLPTLFEISGAPLDWSKLYLSARSQRVSIPGALSDSLPPDRGVPQGSCLGPLLYIIYASKLFNIIECHRPNPHCYADDSQIYLSFKPDHLSSQQDAITAMQTCIDDIRSWMEHDKLLLKLSKVNISLVTVGNSDIKKSSVVRNLGSYIDDKLSMNSHINKVCNASFYYLHNIRWIRKYLSRDSSETLVHAFVSSRLDYCYSLLYGLPQVQINKIQRIQTQLQDLFLSNLRFTI